jgi:uncharacterized membrane protein YhaH (DUF805 family)
MNKHATFNGRPRRREYWLFVFLNTFAGFGFTLLAWIIGLVVAKVELGDGVNASVMAIGDHVGILASIGSERVVDSFPDDRFHPPADVHKTL